MKNQKPLQLLIIFLSAWPLAAVGDTFIEFCRPYQRTYYTWLPFIRSNRSLAEMIQAPSLLGAGTFGKVYSSIIDEIPIAIKVMKNRNTNVNEIDILLKLKDLQGVPKLIKCEITNTEIYLAQNLLHESFDSHSLIARFGEKSFGERLAQYKRAAMILESIHKKGYLHGDIKPANLMADNSNIDNIYFIDFGLSRKKGTRMLGGTPSFFSPEILINKSDYAITEKDDLWALALAVISIELKKDFAANKQFGNCLKLLRDMTMRSSRVNQTPLCTKILIDDMADTLDSQKEALVQQCSLKSFEHFTQAMVDSFIYSNSQRSSVSKFINKLQKAINKCHSRPAATKPLQLQAKIEAVAETNPNHLLQIDHGIPIASKQSQLNQPLNDLQVNELIINTNTAERFEKHQSMIPYEYARPAFIYDGETVTLIGKEALKEESKNKPIVYGTPEAPQFHDSVDKANNFPDLKKLEDTYGLQNLIGSAQHPINKNPDYYVDGGFQTSRKDPSGARSPSLLKIEPLGRSNAVDRFVETDLKNFPSKVHSEKFESPVKNIQMPSGFNFSSLEDPYYESSDNGTIVMKVSSQASLDHLKQSSGEWTTFGSPGSPTYIRKNLLVVENEQPPNGSSHFGVSLIDDPEARANDGLPKENGLPNSIIIL